MSYSCSDFTGDVLSLFADYGLIEQDEDIPDDDPHEQYHLIARALYRRLGENPYKGRPE